MGKGKRKGEEGNGRGEKEGKRKEMKETGKGKRERGERTGAYTCVLLRVGEARTISPINSK